MTEYRLSSSLTPELNKSPWKALQFLGLPSAATNSAWQDTGGGSPSSTGQLFRHVWLGPSLCFGPTGSPGAQAWGTWSPPGHPHPCSPRRCPRFSFLFLLVVRISVNAAVPETMRQDAHPLYETSPACRPTASQGLGPTEVALSGRSVWPGQTAQPSPARPGPAALPHRSLQEQDRTLWQRLQRGASPHRPGPVVG